MVLDELGEPIIGANIVEKGTTNGTITDMDGNYSLTVNDLKKAVLQASFIGYNTIEESVKGRSTVEIKLSPSVVNLGEVVAIGYGTQPVGRSQDPWRTYPKKVLTKVSHVTLPTCCKAR